MKLLRALTKSIDHLPPRVGITSPIADAAKEADGNTISHRLLPGITVIAVSQLIEGWCGRLEQTSPLSVGHPDTLGRPFDSDSALARITFQPAGQKCLDFRANAR